VFATVFSDELPPQADSSGAIAATPAIEAAAVMNFLRFNSVPMLGRPFSIEVSKRVDGPSKRFDVGEISVTPAA
jgi:hypothetical protein